MQYEKQHQILRGDQTTREAEKNLHGRSQTLTSDLFAVANVFVYTT